MRQNQASEILQCSWLGKFTHFILIQNLYITSLPLLNKLNFPVSSLLLTSPNQRCMADLFRQRQKEQIFFSVPQISVIAPAATTSAFPDTEKADIGKHPAT